MKKSMIVAFLMLLIHLPVVCAAEFQQGNLFKIKLVSEHETVQCEYYSPDTYQCEKNGYSLDEKQARRELSLLFHQLHLRHDVKVEEMVHSLEKTGYNNVKFLDVRWMDSHHRLFTWIWEKDK
ncbi:hypothetical protein [Thermaerobacillus caldiproteolyticus]|uniref:hypothetical protein n=1 Tax=Thermaerobacillus caldiproteolyticus TaxID=247480 RepID=UPI0018F24FF7|nr:hypothetical protein [Anoxybacillus caldiproteolyticus]